MTIKGGLKDQFVDFVSDVKDIAGDKVDNTFAAVKNTGKKAKETVQLIDTSTKVTAEKIKESKIGEGVTQVGDVVSDALVVAVKATSSKTKRVSTKVVEKVDAAKNETKESIKRAKNASKEVHINVLSFINKQKNKQLFKSKRLSFEDGIKQGKLETVEFIKKYTNYYLAITAISYFFARCDGVLDEAEKIEIDRDLESIVKNKDLPENIVVAMEQIASDETMTFSDVAKYLDNISVDTLRGLKKDVEEIINANNEITDKEADAYNSFLDYCQNREERCDK